MKLIIKERRMEMSELKAGDLVEVNGSLYVDDGDKVRVLAVPGDEVYDEWDFIDAELGVMVEAPRYSSHFLRGWIWVWADDLTKVERNPNELYN